MSIKENYWLDWVDHFVPGKLYKSMNFRRGSCPEPLLFLEMIDVSESMDGKSLFKFLDAEGELCVCRAMTLRRPETVWERVL